MQIRIFDYRTIFKRMLYLNLTALIMTIYYYFCLLFLKENKKNYQLFISYPDFPQKLKIRKLCPAPSL